MSRVLACALLLSSGALAQAAPPQQRVRFVWERGHGAESCPGEAELSRRIAARIGNDPFSDTAQRSIAARVEREGEVWRTEVRVLDGEGRPLATREPLESTATDCEAIADAVVLAVALTIDPSASGSAEAGSQPQLIPEPPTCPSCPVTSCPVQPSLPCPTPVPQGTNVRAVGSLRALGVLGVLPVPAAGVSLAAELEPWQGVAFGLAMHYLPEVETDSGELALGLTAGELFSCPELIAGAFAAVSVCAGFQVGSLHALSPKLRPVSPGDYLWLAPSLGPRGTAALSRAARLELGSAAVVPLVAHDFTIRGRSAGGYAPARVALFAWIGLGWTTR